ncbi:MAG: enoyl-CoA hydratase-related protein [Planctomycetota bacterium]|nr:enoyl-CoA hydratase-related protein [Planctomycetota bacterium]
MTDENILVETDERIGFLTLNRPEKKNALIGSMRETIREVVSRWSSDPLIRVIVIRGTDGSFCAGGDVGYMAQLALDQEIDTFAEILRSGKQTVLALRRCPKPILASIDGPAFGAGMNLALACDLRIASESARFAQSFVRVGLAPDWGGSLLLRELIGTARATELIYTARALDASEALRLGILNQVVSASDLESTTRTWADELSRSPWRSLAESKRLLHPISHLEKALDLEIEAQLNCFRSPDAREGFQAFIDKRPAIFAPEAGTLDPS